VDKLTPRESEVFALVVHDKLNEQIAYELAVTGWRSGRLR
jgi:FixJ family two-component response regulator